jgi:hypothetical protein
MLWKYDGGLDVTQDALDGLAKATGEWDQDHVLHKDAVRLQNEPSSLIAKAKRELGPKQRPSTLESEKTEWCGVAGLRCVAVSSGKISRQAKFEAMTARTRIVPGASRDAWH